jgi:dolichol-phosphate mannosyltransferase
VIDDNSPDGTARIAEVLASDFPLKVIKRTKERGLGSAIIAGINQATSKVVCVIDADLSHPPESIPEMYKIIAGGEVQLVIGSRRVAGGGTSEWIWYRKFIHWVAAKLGSFLTPVKDLTSGYFMFDKKIINGVKLEPKSWKIGLEIIVKGKYNNVVEHPIVFVEREAGKSKMGSKEVFAYLGHLLSLTAYRALKR